MSTLATAPLFSYHDRCVSMHLHPGGCKRQPTSTSPPSLHKPAVPRPSPSGIPVASASPTLRGMSRPRCAWPLAEAAGRRAPRKSGCGFPIRFGWEETDCRDLRPQFWLGARGKDVQVLPLDYPAPSRIVRLSTVLSVSAPSLWLCGYAMWPCLYSSLRQGKDVPRLYSTPSARFLRFQAAERWR